MLEVLLRQMMDQMVVAPHERKEEKRDAVCIDNQARGNLLSSVAAPLPASTAEHMQAIVSITHCASGNEVKEQVWCHVDGPVLVV
eukprot:740457-Pelagomonas_calceolata.AAC.3